MLCANPLYRVPLTAAPFFTHSQLRDFPRPNNGAWYFNKARYDALFSSSQRLIASEIGCGQCLACRLNRAKKWAVRCVKESETSGLSAFVTLTYDDSTLPRRLIVHPVTVNFSRAMNYRPGTFNFFSNGCVIVLALVFGSLLVASMARLPIAPTITRSFLAFPIRGFPR